MADDYGNVNGGGGPPACGSLGYAFPNAEYADRVVAVTDTLAEYPLAPVSIPQTRVDYVVEAQLDRRSQRGSLGHHADYRGSGKAGDRGDGG